MLPMRPDCHLIRHHNEKSTPINRNVAARLSANALSRYHFREVRANSPSTSKGYKSVYQINQLLSCLLIRFPSVSQRFNETAQTEKLQFVKLRLKTFQLSLY